jgi:hypothetical protein
VSEVVFNVAVATQGTYLIWARGYSSDSNHDSFFVSVDKGPDALFRVAHVSAWLEEGIFDDASEVKTAIHYAWNAGQHQVVVKCRNDAVKLDRIRIDTLPP